ncbi:hypothetical protein U9M48_005592 [Paspalum notatum var. saurae]|uniref:Uncharacterized protein n=1 Tax=Paspalum notatum var. saurae TaxID=547442 RepID=A0AAQ3SFK3_PASNO
MGEDGSEEVVQRRGTRKSHYISPPPVPAPAARRLIRPIGDGQWEDVTWDGTGGLCRKVLDQTAMKICKDTFSNIRLQVTNAWLKSQGQPLGRFRDCLETYLTAEEYKQTGHPLFADQPGPYKALSQEEYQRQQQAHHEYVNAQQMAAIQVVNVLTAGADICHARS